MILPGIADSPSPGGIAKAFGLDDGPTHTQAAIAKPGGLDDATQARLGTMVAER
jgi:hypothetical protein